MGIDLITPWSWGYWCYDNPYCYGPVVVDNTTIDYSQPLVLASPGAAPAADADGAWQTSSSTTPEDAATGLMEIARSDFLQANYTAALADCNQSITRLPNSSAAHEFRGLALFALGRYQEAAGPVYAVLSVGPGWDWPTLIGFYPNVDVYTGQLRALEQYLDSNPHAVEARFLLAYHYMTCGHTDAAVRALKSVVEQNPRDRLSAQLLSAMTPTAATPAPKSATAAPAKPVDAVLLAGQWKAARPDGTTIELSLTQDGRYTWKYVQKNRPQQFSGTYTLAGNVLILKENESPMMVGQVTLLAGNQFNFKLPGDNPRDPGLTFGK